jgi:hypothetical protein
MLEDSVESPTSKSAAIVAKLLPRLFASLLLQQDLEKILQQTLGSEAFTQIGT